MPVPVATTVATVGTLEDLPRRNSHKQMTAGPPAAFTRGLSRIGFVSLNLGCPVCVGFVVSLSYSGVFLITAEGHVLHVHD